MMIQVMDVLNSGLLLHAGVLHGDSDDGTIEYNKNQDLLITQQWATKQ